MITRSTEGTSRPLAATSVATRQRMRPVRKPSMTWSRWCCPMSPCSTPAPICDSFSFAASSSHSFLVSVKTKVLPKSPAWTLQRSPMQSPRMKGGQEMHLWVILELVAFASVPLVTSIHWGSFRCFSTKALTHLGSVAEKSRIWRFSLGKACRMASTSSWNPMDSISSASSRIRVLHLERSTVCRLMWSSSRPGVQTSRSTPARTSSHWPPKGVPP
mmetsp:Transcript_12981/g.37834  ORF Transcript_12981/g.37834 Transcript_12981/m.37834 type:complete len:216 (+) Transcript_12981:809-1456(+)